MKKFKKKKLPININTTKKSILSMLFSLVGPFFIPVVSRA
jgi:hypothetical protein